MPSCMHLFDVHVTLTRLYVGAHALQIAMSTHPLPITYLCVPIRAKLLARIAAVPDNRLLLESDQGTADAIDDSLREIAAVAAEAKGWPLEKVVQVANANFEEFIQGRS